MSRECESIYAAYGRATVWDQNQALKSYKDQSSDVRTESRIEKNETHTATSSLEKTVVFFYPSQWNIKVEKTAGHNQEKIHCSTAGYHGTLDDQATGRWGME